MLSCLWLYLTHWGQDKMVDMFQTTFSNTFSWKKMNEFRLRFRLFLRVQLIIFQHMFQIMVWRRTGDKPLSEPTMVWFSDAYMRHSTSLSSRFYPHSPGLFHRRWGRQPWKRWKHDGIPLRIDGITTTNAKLNSVHSFWSILYLNVYKIWFCMKNSRHVQWNSLVSWCVITRYYM